MSEMFFSFDYSYYNNKLRHNNNNRYIFSPFISDHLLSSVSSFYTGMLPPAKRRHGPKGGWTYSQKNNARDSVMKLKKNFFGTSWKNADCWLLITLCNLLTSGMWDTKLDLELFFSIFFTKKDSVCITALAAKTF